MIIPLEITLADMDKNKIYYSVVGGIVYYNNHIETTTFAKKGKKHHRLFKNTCLTHNFRPFKYKKMFYGIGGQDNWKVDKKWRGIDYNEFKAMYKDHFNKPYIREESFYDVIKYKFDTTPIMPHNRGLYLLKSDDGINWGFVQKDPIITVNSKGFNDSLKWKSSEFDSIPEIIRFKDKWHLYLRNNIAADRRDIQFSTSDDLIKWDTFKPIKHEYDIDIDNYYQPVMFEHKKRLFGFFNYYNKEKSCVKIKVSNDGKFWNELIEIFNEKPHVIVESNVDKTKLNSMVCSTVKTDHNIFIWVNHFYNSNKDYHNSYLAKYKIPMGEFNELL